MEEHDTDTTGAAKPTGSDIEGALLDGVEEDDRFASGVPENLRGQDLDFIQMTGLTAPVESGAPAEPDVQADDLDPEMPVSFYEEGVDDVDSSNEPLGTEAGRGAADDVIVPNAESPVSSSIASLKEIVADLTAGETAPEQTGTEQKLAAADDVVSDRVADPEPVETDSQSDAMIPLDEFVETDDPPTDDFSDAPTAQEPAKTNTAADIIDAPAAEEPTAPEIPPPPVTPEPAPPAIPDPIAIAEDDPVPAVLNDAEHLLKQLEEEVRTETRSDSAENADSQEERYDFGIPEIPEATVHEDDPETDETVYNRPNIPKRRKGGGRRRSVRKRLTRLVALAVFGVLLGIGGYLAYTLYWTQTASEQDVYRRAVRHYENGNYGEAAQALSHFADRYPASPLAAEALFMAARAHEAAAPSAGGDSLTLAAQYYGRFRQEHPEHAKAHRAATLTGLLHLRMDDYENAIAILQRPELRTQDPEGYLAALRGLGRAHAGLGQLDQARSAYHRAASLEGNFTTDEDYESVAELYLAFARTADSEPERHRLQRVAVEQLGFALRSPGITAGRKRDLDARRQMLLEELGVPIIDTVGAGPAAVIDLDDEHRQEQLRLMTID